MKNSKEDIEAQLIGKQWRQFIGFLMLAMLGLTTALGMLILEPDLTTVYPKKKIDTSRRTVATGGGDEDDNSRVSVECFGSRVGWG